MKIGIIGSGHIGGTLTRRLTALGHDVSVANSRGPESLTDLARETGATAATAEDAVRDADLVAIAIPVKAVPDLPDLSSKVVIDANNYYPSRDGRIEAIENGATSARWTADQTGAVVVKAFNTIESGHLLALGRPAGDPARIAVPVAADDAQAKQIVMRLVEQLGFDAVDAGGLDESWRQQPGTPVYGTDLDAARARAGLAAA
ncbi:NADPH-dependent F420 reductase [Candidatus Solirubrobacter pratensis]|uniref:NADPH-dependent F420 reductase n=1 Tax=Candidatus Solirubrobacter pratensis TaxID=1298857 RepID=UPI0003F7952A|nr:NAD(P)-binding domain-containing protein [Candidatus Solirubrobacter pratensis]